MGSPDWLRFTIKIALAYNVQPDTAEYLRVILVLIPLWLSLFALLGLYDFRHLLGGTTEYSRAVNACTSGMMFVVIASFILPEFQVARAWLVMAWLLTVGLVCAGRFVMRRIAYRLRRQGYFISQAVIVGTNREALMLATQLSNSSQSGLAILGFIDANHSVENDYLTNHFGDLPILGELHRLPEIIKEKAIEEVVIATTALTRDQLLDIPYRLADLEQVELRLSSGLYEVFTTGMTVTTKGTVPLMSANRLRLDPVETLLKSILDYGIILCSSLILLPLFAVIAVLVKLDSEGPIFYRRRVLGLAGKEFDAFKFRTMVVNGDEILDKSPQLRAELAANHKLKHDPRVTRIGRWLRRTSLDELPQLINVLLGQMSLVGPRMISPAETTHYGAMQLNLLTVKPGLTGLWQVSGRSDLSYVERVKLDMHYIRNYSVWLDLQILFVQTLPAVFKKKGAY